MSALFLTSAEIAELTGRKMKSHQREWLRKQGVPFRVNASGHPVVTRAAVVGIAEAPPTTTPRLVWRSAAIGA